MKKGDEWNAYKNKYDLTDDDFSSWRREKMRDHRLREEQMQKSQGQDISSTEVSLPNTNIAPAQSVATLTPSISSPAPNSIAVIGGSTSVVNAPSTVNQSSNTTAISSSPASSTNPVDKKSAGFRGRGGGW